MGRAGRDVFPRSCPLLPGNLGAIDPQFDVAVTTACPQLDNFVVDTAAGAQRCVDYLRTINGRGKFIILEEVCAAFTLPSPALGTCPRHLPSAPALGTTAVFVVVARHGSGAFQGDGCAIEPRSAWCFEEGLLFAHPTLRCLCPFPHPLSCVVLACSFDIALLCTSWLTCTGT
jgi:hypothetical protein